MKDFAAPEYIRPITDEIMNEWKFKDLRKWQPDAIYLEERHPKHRHTCAANLRRLAYNNVWEMSESARALFRALDDWTIAAETYKGELDEWSDHERRRIADAVRMTLLNRFEKEAAA